MTDFTLPELGEQIEAGDVLRVLVKAGDTITKEQPVLELETDKATIEVPSSVAGTVKEIKVKAGDKVKVGQAILSYDENGAGAATPKPASGEGGKAAAAEGGKPAEAKAAPAKPAPAAPKAAAKAEPAKAPAEKVEDTAEMQPQVEIKNQSTQPDKAGVKDPTVGPDAAADSSRPDRAANVVDITRGARPAAEAATLETPPAPAAPSVRRTARELGVDISEVHGSGPNG